MVDLMSEAADVAFGVFFRLIVSLMKYIRDQFHQDMTSITRCVA